MIFSRRRKRPTRPASRRQISSRDPLRRMDGEGLSGTCIRVTEFATCMSRPVISSVGATCAIRVRSHKAVSSLVAALVVFHVINDCGCLWTTLTPFPLSSPTGRAFEDWVFVGGIVIISVGVILGRFWAWLGVQGGCAFGLFWVLFICWEVWPLSQCAGKNLGTEYSPSFSRDLLFFAVHRVAFCLAVITITTPKVLAAWAEGRAGSRTGNGPRAGSTLDI